MQRGSCTLSRDNKVPKVEMLAAGERERPSTVATTKEAKNNNPRRRGPAIVEKAQELFSLPLVEGVRRSVVVLR